jgi:hypothetical protein
VAGKVIGGWQVNTIITLQSGEPLQITGGNTSPLNTALQRPNWTGKNATLSGAVQSRLGGYFDTAQFSLNTPFHFRKCAAHYAEPLRPGAGKV